MTPATRLGVVRIGVGLAVATIGTGVFVANQEDSAVAVPAREQTAIRAVLPEQWGFFTRSPREPSVVAITSDGDRLYPNVQARYRFGADRTPRAVGIEIGVMLRSIPDDAWIRCRSGIPDDCARDAPPTRVTGTPQLCGAVTLLRFTPAPWAFLAAGSAQDRIEATRIRASC